MWATRVTGKGDVMASPETSAAPGPGLDGAVFTASEGEVLGPITAGIAGGIVVAKVHVLDLVDPVELSGSRDDLRARLMTERGAQLMRSILNERRRDTVVTVDDELLQRFAPTRS